MNGATNCEQCAFNGESVKDLVSHILTSHKNNAEIIHCQSCEFKAIDINGLNDHMETDHIELVYLRHVDANQVDVSRSFEKFKDELTSILNVIIDDHNTMKQEFFILHQEKHDRGKQMDKIENAVLDLTKLVSPSPPAQASSSKESQKESSQAPSNSIKPSVPMPKAVQEVFKVCVIGDSLIGSLDTRVIANAMKVEVRTARAYSTINDSQTRAFQPLLTLS